MERETYPFDVLFVGGGPAGLAGAIRLGQLAEKAGRELEIGVIEKASQPGLHCMSGAVFDPSVLKALLPDYESRGFPGGAPVRWDAFHYMLSTSSIKIPGPLVPPPNKNHGYVALSIQKLVGWLSDQAEEVGVTVLTDTCGTEVLYGDSGEVTGVRTGDKGLDSSGQPMGNHEPGYDLTAKVTVFGEGPYGTLTEDLMHRKRLREGRQPQLYSLGVKEVIKVDCADKGFEPDEGFAVHTLGWPMPGGAFGGGWLYHQGGGMLSVGYVLGLGWQNPSLDLQEVFNEYKKHPLIQRYIGGGEILTYGAKTIPEGGYFSIPKLHCDGALVVGDSAGLVNVRTLKGIHYAMQSGVLAAETAFEAVAKDDASESMLEGYRRALDDSFVMQDLWRDRNFRGCFEGNFHVGLVKSVVNDFIGGGSKTPWADKPDYQEWKKPSGFSIKRYPKDDYDPGTIVDKLTDVHHSGTAHREDQPSHIRIVDPGHCATACMPAHEGVAPCTNFCPAAVYELKSPADDAAPIQVNFTNCVHCRTCVIADPCDVDGEDHYQNIVWRAPNEGGPRYLNL